MADEPFTTETIRAAVEVLKANAVQPDEHGVLIEVPVAPGSLADEMGLRVVVTRDPPPKPRKPRRMSARQLAYLRERSATGCTGFVSFAAIRQLLDDRDWHRARVVVTPDDVRRRRVTFEQVETWAHATDRHRGLFQGCTPGKPEWAERDAEDNGGRQMARLIESLIKLACTTWSLVQLDVLDEIAATKVGSGHAPDR